MIPLELLFAVWFVAVVTSTAATTASFGCGKKAQGFTLVGIAIGSLAMLSFYIMLLSPFRGSLQMTVTWSRWAIVVLGFVIISGSIAGYIRNRKL